MNTTAEFLRKLADLIDLVEKGQSVQSTETTPAPDNTATMIPPLQQNIELLKKIAGVESAYDENSNSTANVNSVISSTDTDVDTIKRNVGIIDALNAATPLGS